MARTLHLAGPLLALALIPACGEEPAAPPTTDESAARAEVAPTGEEPRLVARINLSTEHLLSFYDAKVGALVQETGLAGSTPVFRKTQDMHADKLVDIWQTFSTEAAPKELVALQQRLLSLPESATAKVSNVARTPQTGGLAMNQQAPGGSDDGLLAAPSGCNNGCCDYDWLSTALWDCNGNHGFPINWFDYNYGWSYENVGDSIEYEGTVCAAVGTSIYKLDVGSVHGNWSVVEAHYMTNTWLAGKNWLGWFSPQNMTSSVNTVTTAQLHTYCGLDAQD